MNQFSEKKKEINLCSKKKTSTFTHNLTRKYRFLLNTCLIYDSAHAHSVSKLIIMI